MEQFKQQMRAIKTVSISRLVDCANRAWFSGLGGRLLKHCWLSYHHELLSSIMYTH